MIPLCTNEIRANAELRARLAADTEKWLAEKEQAIIERVQLCRDYYNQLADEYAAQTR